MQLVVISKHTDGDLLGNNVSQIWSSHKEPILHLM